MTFRSEQRENLDVVCRGIKEAQKQLKNEELQGGESAARRAGAPASTEPLQLLRPFPCLRDLNVRPNIGGGSKKSLGTLEAHANGFRLSGKGTGEKIDILYSDIKHAIFEPCTRGKQLIVLHFHLHRAITVGKKKVFDVQANTEVGVLVDDLSMRRAGSAYDPDEILEEQNERMMKARLNTLFKDFCKQVEGIKSCPLKFDVPVEDLAFQGVVHKGMIDLCFGSSMLCGLQEFPPICITLDDIDLVVFERCTNALREFDLALIKKDYEEPVIRISTIPSKHNDMMRHFFAQKGLTWYSNAMNLNWPRVMKDVVSDTKLFVEQGGWDAWFASAGSDSEEDAAESSDFQGDSDDEDDDDDDVVEDGDDFAPDDDDDDSGDGEDDSEAGLSWDELEARAEKADRKRERSRSRDRDKASRAAPARPKRARR